MYAVFQTGSKQYRVSVGEVINIELLNNSNIGDQIEFDRVLLIKGDNFIHIGNPLVKTGQITAKIIEVGLYKKISIVKFRRRKHSRKCLGHRQRFTKIKILSINNKI
ncbi:50S ribosomal protein L21 [Candidatus Blochmannia ocreatus (nom. nud.)]|uniref:Large ribosomal subunit protein bL21 n=1 Tax=Candidatus Blochmannia ocreatus (nom. nud.) TaxID=251538 RepID=A0ABY4SUM7_9ENTR|nr:50S ribosomal protein L21 [Candidatus Blochmannia ocreatus]URJ25178.1 50S ribosomal protein L21 [Candidatus Blochmannia ocreatus]